MTEFNDIPYGDIVFFINGRMQPPTKGHIELIKSLLHCYPAPRLSQIVLSLGWSPLDQYTQINTILAKIDPSWRNPNSSWSSELSEIINNEKLSNKTIAEAIVRLNEEENLYLIRYNSDVDDWLPGLMQRVSGYRAMCVKPHTPAIIEKIKKNPFSFWQREALIRAQLTEEENSKIAIIPALGVQDACRTLKKGHYYNGDSIFVDDIIKYDRFTRNVYVASGEEYADRATHQCVNRHSRVLVSKDNPYGIDSGKNKNGYHMVLVTPRPNKDVVSGTIAREMIQDACKCLIPIEQLYQVLFDTDNPTDLLKSLVCNRQYLQGDVPLWEESLLYTYGELVLKRF